MKIGRNQKCPCGSYRKYKKCCLYKHLFSEPSASKLNIENKYADLFGFNYELIKVADKMLQRKYDDTDEKQVFTYFSLGKSYKTLKAILLLCSNGYGQDSAILARSLIDLLITLQYILKDSSKSRIQRYFDYDWILRKKMYDYAESKPELLEIIQNRIKNPKQNQDSVTKVRAQAKIMQAKYRYGRTWAEINIKEMAIEIGRLDLYSTAYALQSQILHNAPRVMNEYLIDDGKNLIVNTDQDDNWVEPTLVTAFDCFFHISAEYDKLLELGFASDLDRLVVDFHKQVGKINKEDSLN